MLCIKWVSMICSLSNVRSPRIFPFPRKSVPIFLVNFSFSFPSLLPFSLNKSTRQEGWFKMEIQLIPYYIIAYLIQGYKWVELKLIHLFKSRLERRIFRSYARIGVIFDVDSHSKGGKDSKLERKEYEEDVAKRSEYKKLLRVKVHDKRWFLRLANNAPMAMGEGYMNREWDCDNKDLMELVTRIFKKRLYLVYLNPWNRFINYVTLCFFNLQTKERVWEAADAHYDLGNDLFESYLDPWLTYSCAYWAKATNLNEAQVHKMELIAEKLKLKPGMRVLDIGCGWGGTCKFLAMKYGVECVGITISKEGAKYAQESCKGLSVEIRLTDYRDVHDKFDRVLSLGMFEHVGVHNYREYFEVCHRCLKDDGIVLLQTIGINHKEMVRIEPFFATYFFPNGCLPYYQDITKYTEGLFILEDWHVFSQDYVRTLQAWLENFKKNWPKISHKYGDKILRLWTYYFNSCSGAFNSRQSQLWQIVLSKDGLDDYRAAR